MTQFITKKDLLAWLANLMRECTLVAPLRAEGITLYRPVGRIEDIVLDKVGTTDLSPKDCFFPPSEVIFTVTRKDGRLEVQPKTVEKEAVLFGIRPCDAQGIARMDQPFLSEPADPLYAQRREKTTIVGLACRQSCPECFCTSMGSGPHDTRYQDIQLLEVNEGYIAQALTGKGRHLLAGAAMTEREMEVPPPPEVQTVPVAGIQEVARRAFQHPYWDRLADRCIHCDVCAYVCPVCYCFDIRDYPARGGVVERVRSWESCQSPGFTRLAGGYDPRAAKGAKLRQRFYHKLFYQPQQFDGPPAAGCTGCGRCVRACSVNIDIREIITTMQKIGAEVATGAKA